MIVKQRNPYDCLAACLAMILCTTIEDVYLQIGHDGTRTGRDGQRIKITMRDAMRVLLVHGFALGTYIEFGEVITQFQHWQSPALVIVNGVNEFHAVLFDGRNVLDPSPRRVGTYDLDDYQILQWWPVWKFEAA